jgi:replicative DNA helicase
MELEETYNPLKPEASAKTGGGGRHLYFKWSGGVYNSQGMVGPGIDVRGAGGYVVAPPSVHLRGKYEWLDEPDGELSYAPDWLLSMARKSQRQKGEDKVTLPDYVIKGERNGFFIRYAGKLRRAGFDESDILTHLSFLNSRCVDREGVKCPMDEDELKRLARSAARYGVEAAKDIDKEFALVGCVWASPKYQHLIDRVPPGAFGSEECKYWWEMMRSIAPRRPDHVSMGVTQHQYNEIISEVPDIDNANVYAEHIRAPYARKLMRGRLKRVEHALDGEQPEAEVLKLLAEVPERDASQILRGGAVSEADFEEESLAGLPTNTPIDNFTTCKGLPMGQTTIVRGRTGHGKTPLLVQFAINALKDGKRVLYWSFSDLNAAQLMQTRFIPQLCGLTQKPVNLEELEEWTRAKDYLLSLNLLRYDDEASIERVCAEVEARHRENPIDLICLDYLQSIHSDKGNSVLERTQFVCKGCNTLANKTGIAVAVASQVTFKNDEDVSRYGTEADNDAGLILNMGKRTGDEGDVFAETRFKMAITKNRFGPLREEMPATFNSQYLRFDFE